MSFSLAYLAGRFAYRIGDFLRHWYVDGFRRFSHATVSVLEVLDRRFALLVTLRHFFVPLYQDYTLIGYIMGIFFRFWRVCIALIMYAVIIVVGAAAYAMWALIPVAIPIVLRIS